MCWEQREHGDWSRSFRTTRFCVAVACVTILADVEDRDNVRVVQRRGEARLADEALANPGMMGEGGLQCYGVPRSCYLTATVPKL
jgi:hypothetical protein